MHLATEHGEDEDRGVGMAVGAARANGTDDFEISGLSVACSMNVVQRTAIIPTPLNPPSNSLSPAPPKGRGVVRGGEREVEGSRLSDGSNSLNPLQDPVGSTVGSTVYSTLHRLFHRGSSHPRPHSQPSPASQALHRIFHV